MKVESHTLPRSTIEAFADKHGLVMEIHERSPVDSQNRFYAHFKRVEVSDGSVLIGTYGNGATPEDAIAAYGEKIAGKLIVVDAFGSERREIAVPVIVAAIEARRVAKGER